MEKLRMDKQVKQKEKENVRVHCAVLLSFVRELAERGDKREPRAAHVARARDVGSHSTMCVSLYLCLMARVVVVSHGS